jgi:glycosyltransferase involved in cell wall biosynthesis
MAKTAVICRNHPQSGIYCYTRDLLDGFPGGEKPDWVTFEFDAQGQARWSEPLERFSCLHFQYEGGEYQWKNQNLMLRFLEENRDRKIVVTLHEIHRTSPFAYDPEKIRSVFPFLEAWKKKRYWKRHPLQSCEKRMAEIKYGNAHLIVHLASHRSLLWERGVEETRIRVIPLGLPSWPRPPVPARSGAFRLATFGFLTQANDYQTVLEALSLLPADYQYTIMGGPRTEEGEKVVKEIRQRIRKLRLEDRVFITGFIPEKEVPGTLAQADIFVAPLAVRSNSASLAYMLAAGRPVIASDIPYSREIQEEGAGLVLYRGGDGHDLAERIRQAPGLVSSQGQEFLASRTWPAVARMHSRYYHEVNESWVLETRYIVLDK